MIPDALAALTVPLKGTFFEYVHITLSSTMAAQWMVLVFSGILGVCANYAYKWLTEQITESLWKYLFVDFPRHTMLSFAVYLGWTFIAISTGIVSDAMTWGAVINLGMTTGFSVDALVNKARRSQWTDEERAAKNSTP